MVKTLEGKLTGRGVRIGIVVSKFNDFITRRLLNACIEELTDKGVRKSDITVAWVPGAFEIPVAAQKLAKKKTIDAVICLGAIIRGETYHYDLVAYGATYGVQDVALKTGKPVIFEILAADTVTLLDKRSKVKGDNKGRDAAQTAVEMVKLLSQLS